MKVGELPNSVQGFLLGGFSAKAMRMTAVLLRPCGGFQGSQPDVWGHLQGYLWRCLGVGEEGIMQGVDRAGKVLSVSVYLCLFLPLHKQGAVEG